MPARGPAIIRDINRFDVLQTIRVHDGQVSRSELSEITGLSQATISSIVGHLLEEGALIEGNLANAEVRGRGRPLVSLRLNPQYTHVVGVKIATYRIVFSVTDFAGNVIASDDIPVEPLKLTPEELATFIGQGVRTSLKKARMRLDDVSGIGVGIPGYIDWDSGMVFWSPVFKHRDVSFRQMLQAKFRVPVFLENDANMVTLAEHWFGKAKGLDHAFVVTIEHGTGSGLILNGRLYRGANGLAAEFGHTKISLDGPECQCGERGCMETHTAAFALLREAARVGFPVPKRPLDYPKRSQLLRRVIEQADAGDKRLRRIFQQMGRYLGLGIANVINLLNPQKVIVCEGAVQCAHLYQESLRATVAALVLEPLQRRHEIVIHHWGDEVWARGSASLVLLELDQRGRPATEARRLPKDRDGATSELRRQAAGRAVRHKLRTERA
jgi:predicted NBD/HSP70 family sugar kinase